MAGIYDAGVFVADDHIIVWTREHNDKQRHAYLPHETQRDVAPQDLDSIINRAIQKIGKMVDGRLRSICFAVPGPILIGGSREQGVPDYGRMGPHRRGSTWSRSNISVSMKNALAIADTSVQEKFLSAEVRYFHDAAAYAFGDFCIRSSQGALKADEAVLAHVLVDEGVGTALINRGTLFEGRMHAEGGHLPVRPHPSETLSPHCQLHRNFGCVESFISIPAISRRWGLNALKEMEVWSEFDDRLSQIAYYISQVCVVFILTNAVSHFSFSGRVFKNSAMTTLVRYHTEKWLSEGSQQMAYPGYTEQVMGLSFEVAARDAGVFGALKLAEAVDVSAKRPVAGAS